MNLVHEYNKVVNAYNNQTISEGKMRYELLKLECVARILNKDWQPPTRSGLKTADYRIIKEDYTELVNLRKSGILNKERFNRDCIKIDAICEAIGVPYPGTENPSINIIVESMDEYDDMDDSDEYADMDEDDEFEEEEEESEPEMEWNVIFSDGSVISKWLVNSEIDWQVDDWSNEDYHGMSDDIDLIIYKNIDDLGGIDRALSNISNMIDQLKASFYDESMPNFSNGHRNHNIQIQGEIDDYINMAESLKSGRFEEYYRNSHTQHTLLDLMRREIEVLAMDQ